MDYQLGNAEKRFADIIWGNEPLSSAALVALCKEKLEWKKSTTYTVLRRLCEKGIFQNDNGCVTSLVSAETYSSAQSKQFVNDSFNGSLPAFLAAFMSGKPISEKDAAEIRKMVDAYRKEDLP